MKGQYLWLGSLILISLWACKNEGDGNVLTPPLMEEPDVETSIRPEMIISGFNHPWGMAFIDEDTWLLTERNGDLLLIDKGISQVLNHGLEVQYGGQGGLLDIRVASDFAQSGGIYLSCAQ